MSAAVEREARVADALRRRTERPAPGRGIVVVERVWRFFCSVRAAAYEIAFLALLVLIGTLKGSIIPAQIPRFVPALEPLVVRWYAFDVFRSLVFSATLALLAVAIVVCTINRVPGIWAAIAAPTVRTPRRFFQTAEPAALLRSDEPPAVVAADLQSLLRARRYRVVAESRDGAVHVYADKHRFGRLATFPFHLALILVLVGGIVGSEFGFREMLFPVPEGTVRDVGYGTGLRLELAQFVDTYDELGAPTEFRSDVVLYDGERPVRSQTVSVNHPMTYGSVTFYQSGFGPAAALRVADEDGATVYDDTVEFTFQSRSNAAAPAAVLDLPAQGAKLEIIFPSVKRDGAPEVGEVDVRAGEVYVQARDWRTNEARGEAAVIAQGRAAALGNLSVEFVRESRFAVFQVASNPGIPILFAASVLLVVALVVTFAFPHRRVRALVTGADGGAEVLIAPLARWDWGGQRSFIGTLADLERRFGAAVPYGRRSDVDG